MIDPAVSTEHLGTGPEGGLCKEVILYMRTRALGAYRRLLRVQRSRFENDIEMQRAASAEIRKHFMENAGESDPATVDKLVRDAEDLVDFIQHNLVQMKHVQNGKYGTLSNHPLPIPLY